MPYISKTESFADEIVEKIITKTDVNKNAVVVTAPIKELFSNAGKVPQTNKAANYASHDGLLNGARIRYTYYNSLRKPSGQRGNPRNPRKPETRIGRIANFMQTGDTLGVVRQGSNIYFYVISDSISDIESVIESVEETVVSKAATEKLYSRAKITKTQTPKINKTAATFRRNPDIQAFIKKAAFYKCQMPGCESKLFKGKDGKKYVEVHHLHPLSEGGKDNIDNCASLCPSCHREIHFGADSKRLTNELAREMAVVHERWHKKFGSGK